MKNIFPVLSFVCGRILALLGESDIAITLLAISYFYLFITLRRINVWRLVIISLSFYVYAAMNDFLLTNIFSVFVIKTLIILNISLLIENLLCNTLYYLRNKWNNKISLKDNHKIAFDKKDN